MENKWVDKLKKKEETRSLLSQNKLKTGFICEIAENRNKKHPGKEKREKKRKKKNERNEEERRKEKVTNYREKNIKKAKREEKNIFKRRKLAAH